MIQKIITGIGIGAVIGVFITSFFLPIDTPFKELFLTKITATSIIAGFFTSIYYHFSKSKLQVFLMSIVISIVVFYTKYLLTGHHFDPITMGAFVGALLGGSYAVIRKITHSIKLYKRLDRLRKRGFTSYS